MTQATVSLAPAGYAPEVAAVVVRSRSTPLADTTNVSTVAGPFRPELGRAIWLTLGNTWTGNVQLLRSTDGGVTKLPLTYGDGTAKPVWSANMQAPVAEETVATATYYLSISLTSGSVDYRMEQ